MSTALGLAGMALFIVCVIGLAASVTWIVVKVTPTRGEKKAGAPDSTG